MPASKPKRKVMRRFALDEISVVDKPAQEGAKVAIMKRKSDTRKSEDLLVTSIVKSFLKKLQLVEPVHTQIAKSLKKNEAGQAWDNLAVLETSLNSIVADSALDDGEKVSMMKSSVGEFLEFSREDTPNVEAALRKILDPGVAKSEEPGVKEAGSTEDTEMNLRQLQKQMTALSGKLDSLIAKQRVSKEADEQDEIDDLDLMVPTAKRKRVAKEGPPAEIGAMSDEDEAAARLRALLSGEKEAAGEYSVSGGRPSMDDTTGMGKDDGAEKADDEGNPFADEEMEPEAEKSDSDEQDDGLVTTEGEEEGPISSGSARPIGGKRASKGQQQMTKRVRLYDDNTIVVEGRTFHKAKVGSGLFAVLTQQQERLNRVEKQARSEREARELLEFSKVAEEQLPHLPGTPEQKASLLKSLAGSLDEDERLLISKMLRAGDGGLASAFRTVGTGGDGDKTVQKARGGFEKRVTAIKARDNCTRVEAMQKARREHPDEFAAYQGN